MYITPEYSVELWSSVGSYIADISEILIGGFRIDIPINDVESLDFTLDLVQFERKCERIGADPRNILDPYRTEVRIRRNGKYILGTQVVFIQGNFNSESANSIEVRCTGYLNFFKDRFITAKDFGTNYVNKTYAQLARQLIIDTQLQINGDFGVDVDIDQASPNQQSDRTRLEAYELQNVKDGIINLTKLQNDRFDFEFTADKKFNVYSRLGSDKGNIELVYPQNLYSMNIKRDASTLYNKIYGVGAGIGEEKITSTYVSNSSSLVYGVRENTALFNSVTSQDQLDQSTAGTLLTYKDMYEVPDLSLTSELLDIDNIKVGDAIFVRVDESTLFKSIEGMYRIIRMNIRVDVDFKESVSVQVVNWS